jgi:hypothetical protein
MLALVHLSLTDAPEIFLTVISTFGVGFLLWFLVELLREGRRMRARQVPGLRFTGVRVLNLEPGRREAAHIVPTVARTKITGEAGKVQVFSVPDQRSSKEAIKMRWLLMSLLFTAIIPGFQTLPRPSSLVPAAKSPAAPPIVAGPLGRT